MGGGTVDGGRDQAARRRARAPLLPRTVRQTGSAALPCHAALPCPPCPVMPPRHCQTRSAALPRHCQTRSAALPRRPQHGCCRASRSCPAASGPASPRSACTGSARCPARPGLRPGPADPGFDTGGGSACAVLGRAVLCVGPPRRGEQRIVMQAGIRASGASIPAVPALPAILAVLAMLAVPTMYPSRAICSPAWWAEGLGRGSPCPHAPRRLTPGAARRRWTGDAPSGRRTVSESRSESRSDPAKPPRRRRGGTGEEGTGLASPPPLWLPSWP